MNFDFDNEEKRETEMAKAKAIMWLGLVPWVIVALKLLGVFGN